MTYFSALNRAGGKVGRTSWMLRLVPGIAVLIVMLFSSAACRRTGMESLLNQYHAKRLDSNLELKLMALPAFQISNRSPQRKGEFFAIPQELAERFMLELENLMRKDNCAMSDENEVLMREAYARLTLSSRRWRFDCEDKTVKVVSSDVAVFGLSFVGEPVSKEIYASGYIVEVVQKAR